MSPSTWNSGGLGFGTFKNKSPKWFLPIWDLGLDDTLGGKYNVVIIICVNVMICI